MCTKRDALLCLALAVSLSGCRSAGKTAPQGPAAPLPDFLNAYVGQRRVLLGEGEARTITRGKGTATAKGACDVAVEIQRVTLGASGLRLAVETLGAPRIGGARAGKGCSKVPHFRNVDVDGVSAGTPPDQVAAALDPLLATPEAYLTSHGTPFDLAAAKSVPKVAARPAPQGDDEERRLGRQVTTWPKPQLSVDPVYYDLSGKSHYQSELAFDAIVGPDGRLYQPQLRTGLGQSHEQLVLRALSLWRYEPARNKGGEPVAAHVADRCTFSID
jgi:hypothetical protein